MSRVLAGWGVVALFASQVIALGYVVVVRQSADWVMLVTLGLFALSAWPEFKLMDVMRR